MWVLLNIIITYNKAHRELIGDVTIDVENVMEDDHSRKVSYGKVEMFSEFVIHKMFE